VRGEVRGAGGRVDWWIACRVQLAPALGTSVSTQRRYRRKRRPHRDRAELLDQRLEPRGKDSAVLPAAMERQDFESSVRWFGFC